MRSQSVLLSAILALALAAPAAAQTAAPQHRQSIGGGARWAYPLVEGGDITGTPGFSVSWRRWIGPHLGIEGALGVWRYSASEEYTHDGYYTADGYVSQPVHASYKGHMWAYNLGLNVLGRIPAGRASIVLGGGPGLFVEQARAESSFNENRYMSSMTHKHFGLQSLAELEVRITDRMAVFGGMHAEVRDVKVADSGVVYPVAGVRVGF